MADSDNSSGHEDFLLQGGSSTRMLALLIPLTIVVAVFVSSKPITVSFPETGPVVCGILPLSFSLR